MRSFLLVLLVAGCGSVAASADGGDAAGGAAGTSSSGGRGGAELGGRGGAGGTAAAGGSDQGGRGGAAGAACVDRNVAGFALNQACPDAGACHATCELEGARFVGCVAGFDAGVACVSSCNACP